MDQTSIEARLEAIEKKVDKNYDLLVRMRRVQRNAHIFRLLYWLVIIGLALGAFYYIEPYLKQLIGIYTDLSNTQDVIQNSFPDVGNLNKLLEQVKGL